MKIKFLIIIILIIHSNINAQPGLSMNGSTVNEFVSNTSASGRQSAFNIMRNATQNQVELLNSQTAHLEDPQEAMSGHFEQINNIIGVAQAAIDLNNAFNILDKGECQPTFSQSDNALMPTNCDETDGCMDCYEKPVQNFNTNRLTLARMWCLYTNTKNFYDKAIAFGNTMSAAVPASGLGWMNAKKTIDGGYANFKNTYDKKLVEVLGSLQKNLVQVSECEKNFGIQDWYQKFGFMYVEMMQLKYKRPD
jgi:hypothetical protein